jgi:hypothetical protein
MISIIFYCMLCLTSCKKEDSIKTENAFFKTFDSDVDVTVIGSLQLEDGNFIIVGQENLQVNPGYAVKLDTKGNILWEKRLSPLNTTIWKVFPLPGIGFATIGYSDEGSTLLTICSYNNDGQLIATKNLNSFAFNGANSPCEFLALKNGNFVFASCQSSILPRRYYLYITDKAFNLKALRFYTPPQNCYGYFFRGIYEMPDSTIALTASTIYIGPNVVDSGEINTLLLRTTLIGSKLSQKILFDKGYSVTPNFLLRHKNGLLSITGRMVGFNSGNGVMVRYVNNSAWGELVSGSITLSTLDTSGKILQRKTLNDYPGNGIISSAKTTAEGGFILCGIVDQSNYPTIPSNTKIYLTKLDANLNQQWTKIINTPSASYGIDVIQTNDGGYFVSGYQKSLNEHFIMMAIKTDASGNTN